MACKWLTDSLREFPVSVCSALPEHRPALLYPFSPSLGYIRECVPSSRLEHEPAPDESEAPPMGLCHPRLQSTPSSCYSEWDGSLWNTWSSVMDGNMASARTSLISSVDSCYTNDSYNLGHYLTAAAGSVSGASMSGKHRNRCELCLQTEQLSQQLEYFGEDLDFKSVSEDCAALVKLI